MALTHLVDTSVLTRLDNPAVVEVLRPLVADGVAAKAVITDVEVGFSARNEREWDELHDALIATVAERHHLSGAPLRPRL